MKKKIGILGATGYTGQELIKILSRHKDAEITFVSSRSYAGNPISSVFGDLLNICDLICKNPDEVYKEKLDILFCALPHKESATFISELIDKIPLIIDLSADFRLDNPLDYPKWYSMEHPCPEHLSKKVFGMCELNRSRIKGAKLIANPGCYPTTVILGLAPLFAKGLIDSKITVDSKSSISGAGRTLKIGNLFVEMNEDMYAYSYGHTHRHIAEMEQELNKIGNTNDVTIAFVPHVIPVNRGILSNIYTTLKQDVSIEEVKSLYREFYKNEKFIRIRDDLPKISSVKYSNYCDIGFFKIHSNTLVITSAIDNIVKGASGQAVQNMNIALGINESEGLI